jgi:hypothetical protein
MVCASLNRHRCSRKCVWLVPAKTRILSGRKANFAPLRAGGLSIITMSSPCHRSPDRAGMRVCVLRDSRGENSAPDEHAGTCGACPRTAAGFLAQPPAHLAAMRWRSDRVVVCAFVSCAVRMGAVSGLKGMTTRRIHGRAARRSVDELAPRHPSP